jgi:hypothetical protein
MAYREGIGRRQEGVSVTQPQKKSLVPSNSNLGRELERVSTALGKSAKPNEDRLTLLRRQAALGDLRDELEKRARRDTSR